MASRLWRFLTTDIAELCSGEVVDNTLEATEAVFGLAEVLKEEGVNVQQLGPLINQLDSLLDVLNSPLGKIVEKSLPFVSIATGLLRFYLEKSKRKLTLANCVALVSQAAYLESLKQCLKNSPNLLQRIGSVPVSAEIQQQTKNLAKTLELNDEKARQVVTRFPMSEVAKEFGTVLQKRLRQSGLEEIEAQVLTQKIAWGTLRHMTAVWAGAAEGLGHLGQPSFSEWQREQEKYQSIDDYLQDEISTGPEEKIFNEVALTFRKIYVPLQVKRLNQMGQVLENELYDLESWVIQELMVARKLGERTKILFIQGEAGRGKSVFCRMFAERVYRELFPAYIPILIRLRQVQSLENNLTQTLTNCLEHQDFVASDAGWLTDNNTRFLFLLDGFDELLLEGRESGGLKEFLQQVEQFQLRPGNHHRFVITGRPLSLQGIDRLISQTQELERLELQPMNDELQKRWYEQWALQFSQEEAEALQVFLAVCPEDVRNGLAREPLLLYLLGRMHREGRLKAEMFADTIGSTEAKVVIYDEAVRWVLEEQRQRENLRLAGLEPENLRRFLTEAAVCVMQSGNEVAKISFLEARLAQDCNNPVYELLQESRKNVAVSDEKLLNNLLTTFYLQPASGDREGSVEFAHKSFGEFLFAERLKDALEDWSKVGVRRSNSYLVSTTTMHWEIYDLLGYGGLNREIVEYLRVLIFQYSDCDFKILFDRLNNFYLFWSEGEFINAVTSENHPRRKMLLLRDQVVDQDRSLGLNQVDVYTCINVIIILLELYRYAKSQDKLRDYIVFYPCGEPGTAEFDQNRLHRIINYSEILNTGNFAEIAAVYLSHVNLSKINLARVDLKGANLSKADLSGCDVRRADFTGANLQRINLNQAYLRGADLRAADLRGANLSNTDLGRAFLRNANLRDANLTRADLKGANFSLTDLTNANLSDVCWDWATQWANAAGLHKARNVPSALTQNLKLTAAMQLSHGMSLAKNAEIQAAISAYHEAQSLDSELEISGQSWNTLCWFGSLHGDASEVLYACENAVRSDPDNVEFKDSRGLARCLIGDIDGALVDFQTSLDADSVLSDSERSRREYWINMLQAGQNPITLEELEELRRAEECKN